ncbi:DUF3313 domain-containing protein [Pseudomonas sp. UL073]|uniref:DUF3313 domain-containing protein n=1 Tax=Zestomonas insulae TaxID=2809017 RepID=A0ABS2IK70_9GAMM|nr:DUF3313 domain-containing protein [Pseudomonas insulae]MBM7062573.1 DUF3313 domain-containing protein [Pseudomonas insulae]
MSKPFLVGALSVALLLAGCASSTTQPEQYSGFLGDYSQLTPATSASGAPVLRWVKPGLDLSQYDAVLVERPQFYPKPQPTAQVSQQTLDQIANYLQQAMQRELSSRMQIVQQPGPRTLVLRSAISSVDVSPEGLKAYEVIPIALVLAAANTAAGTRDENTAIYIEMQALDPANNQPVAQIVRKGSGLQLENDSTQLTLKDLQPVLDVWAKDARNFQPAVQAQK